MATRKKYNTGYSIAKRGKSYTIRVTYKGHTYNYTFHPPEGLSESKQYAAAEKEAIRLRDKVMLGFNSNMPTFSEYADYVIQSKGKLTLKRSTINEYKYLLPRLNAEFGNDKLDTITPARLNRFYTKLSESKIQLPGTGIVKDNSLDNYLKEHKISYKTICDNAHLGKNTVSLAVHGEKVSMKTIDAICNYLQIDREKYFHVNINERPISPKTVKEHITLLNTIFKMAVKERILEFNPVEASIIPKFTRKPVNYYQPEEIAAILDKLSEEELRWQVIISLLIVTGCRRGEIAGLRWKCILWDYNLLLINHEVLSDDEGIYTEDSTKNLDEKYVQVDPDTMQLLRDYKDQFDKMMKTLNIAKKDQPEYCFYQITAPERPIYPSTINNFLIRFSKKNNFKPINPHAFRHSLASALIADGVDEFAVAKQLGHRQVSTTREIYMHQINEHQAKVASRIPQIYKKKKEP